MPLNLVVLETQCAVVRLPPLAVEQAEAVTKQGLASDLFCVVKTADEISFVLNEANAVQVSSVQDSKVEMGWRAIKVQGPLDFGMVGVLSTLLKPLADAQIPVFVISTFDTDYILVKTDKLSSAVETLSNIDGIYVS